jgi:hypothetical protein
MAADLASEQQAKAVAAEAARYVAKTAELIRWLNGLGIRTNGTRIHRYLRYFRELEAGRYEVHGTIFNDPPVHPFESPIDRWLYSLREANELAWIVDGMQGREPKGLREKLELLVGGADFVPLDRKSLSRDTQFELRVAAYFTRGGYEVDVSQRTDVIARRRCLTYFVECKRVASEKQLERRIKDAKGQLREAMPPDALLHRNHGVVALDVTSIGFPKNGLTIGLTLDHVRLALRGKIVPITDHVASRPWLFDDPRLLWVFLQVHVANLALDPGTAFTLVSPASIARPSVGFRQRSALKRLAMLVPGWSGPPLKTPPASGRAPRQRLAFEAGTRIAWDDDLVGHFCSTGDLPPRARGDEVLWVGESSRETSFSYAELAMALIQMTVEEIAAVRADENVFREHLFVLLYLQRYPYEDSP